MALLNRWSALVFCGGLLSSPAPADEGMWTFDNPPIKLIQEKYHFTPTHAVAGPRAPVLGSAERRRIGIFRQPAWPAADQSSRGARPTAKKLHRRTRLHQERLLRGHARPGDEISRPRSQRPHVHGRRDRARRGRPKERKELAKHEFAARSDSHRRNRARKSCRKPGCAPTWSRSIRAANTGSTATRNTPTSHRVRARAADRVFRRRPG